MLYRQASEVEQSYVRYLNDINHPRLKEGYRNGKLDWVEMRDPRWNQSIPPWDEWARQNGYTEVIFTVQRNGYGYGFDGVPIKLAVIVLVIYVLLVSIHLFSVLIRGRAYEGYSDMSGMLALAWSSSPVTDASGVAISTERYQTWSKAVKVKKQEERLQLVLETADVA